MMTKGSAAAGPFQFPGSWRGGRGAQLICARVACWLAFSRGCKGPPCARPDHAPSYTAAGPPMVEYQTDRIPRH